MKREFLKFSLGFAVLALLLTNCTKDNNEMDEYLSESSSTLKAASAWQRVFTEDFASIASLDYNWDKTNRKDYNSNYCQYESTNPTIGDFDYRSCLVLTATKSSNTLFKSGHIKSKASYMPGLNEEYRISASIKLVAMEGSNYLGFYQTYGLWPAFWTVQENQWPTRGEIDIMEGYSKYENTHFASNLFYGTRAGSNRLGISCERGYYVSEGWHTYDQYWKNVNGTVTITIQLDGNTIYTYQNSDNRNLRLQNFGPHNIILNLNVGCTSWNAFDNSQINVRSKTMMWVDYVTVDKRTL